MAFAYGASVIEVVRRREFGKFFMQRAQAMAEIMAKFSYEPFAVSRIFYDLHAMAGPLSESGVKSTVVNHCPNYHLKLRAWTLLHLHLIYRLQAQKMDRTTLEERTLKVLPVLLCCGLP